MRKLLRTTFTFALALVFTAGLAFGQQNQSSIAQTGNSSTATVSQSGQGNYSQLKQSDDFIGGHTATVQQVGSNNYSNIQTQNGGGTAEVYMEGDGNTLEDWSTRQRGGLGANQKNSRTFFDLDINGDQNTVGMTQEFGDGTVDIDGSGNEVGLRQLANANYQVGDFHTAFIKVGGNDNIVDVNQARDGGGSVGGTGGKGNGATVEILRGDLNELDVQQGGSRNKQTIEVDGSSNTYTAKQFGTGNALYLNSRGTGPGAPGGAGGVNSNTFTMTQDGSSNLVDAGIDGVDNTVDIVQNGSNNSVDGSSIGRFDADGLTINGDLNTVNVMQTGVGHTSTNTVTGNNNTISVTQSN